MGEQFFENKMQLPEADSLEGSSISEKVPYYLQPWSKYFGTLQCFSTDPINHK